MSYIRSRHTDIQNFYGSSTPVDLAGRFGTPLYVYNEKILRKRCAELATLSSHEGFRVNYSIKANSNPELLKIIRQEGLMADAMSPGELAMDLAAGYSPGEILYISNNNTPAEMKHALDAGCLVSVDSLSQLELLGSLAPGSKFMARINPGIGEGHHAKVVTGGAASKFGINPAQIPDILALAEKSNLRLAGLNQHIGSLFMRPDAYIAAVEVLLEIAGRLPEDSSKGLEILDFGGGFGIPYHKYDQEERLDMARLGGELHSLISGWAAKTGYAGKFLVEPGRYVVAECGVLLGMVTAVKESGQARFVGTDIGFNVLMRPMLYDSFHDIEIYAENRQPPVSQTIVGNICESGDILARDRLLPPMLPGMIFGVLDAGAYGFSMASNYNDRLLPAEILIQADGSPRLIRRRQTIADLMACLENPDHPAS